MATPKEQAKALGLVYGGFAGWVDPNTRKVLAKTVDGKLVRVDHEENGGLDTEEDLGRLTILDLDFEVIHANPKENKVALADYETMLKSILHVGSDFVILIKKNGEKDAAKFLKSIGIIHGVKLSPLGSYDPEKKKKFVEDKIKDGYTEIQFYDRDAKAVSAVDGLKAPYNKLDIRIDTHKLPTFNVVAQSVAGLAANKEPDEDEKVLPFKKKEKAPPEKKDKDQLMAANKNKGG